jgi:hypothetical protein
MSMIGRTDVWADNETEIDLLGFDYLIDGLEVVLTNPRLLPVTVGVLGDWGSGKTSLLKMAGARLQESNEYVVVPFSPWQYEGYDDVKAALMDQVLGAVALRTSDEDTNQTGLVERLHSKVARMMAGPAAAGRVLLPAAAEAYAAQHGMPAGAGSAAGTALVEGVSAIGKTTAVGADQPQTPAVLQSVAEFRDEFEELVESLEGVEAVVVLIDDLDRCLDPTVIDVFEAIRLFLQVGSTAFVIAANREIVQAAIERRYPSAKEGDPALGKDYLEKIIQIEINVPPLAAAEAETYLNLLFADLRLDEPDMLKIREAAAERRKDGQFAVAMNYGIATEVLESVSPELQADFTIANRVAPALSRGLRGNPRQLKRFLNTMLLRLATAAKRSTELDPAILAKLMVLEQAQSPFQQLFLWQVAQHGVPEELAAAEKAAREETELPNSASAELKAWFASPVVRGWLALDPLLAGTPLGEYFFFSRDRLQAAAPEALLSGKLQALLSRLQLTIAAQRRKAVEEMAALSPEELGPLQDVLLDRAARAPQSLAMTSALELADKKGDVWPPLAAALARIPPKDVPGSLPLRLVLIGKDRTELRAVFDQWATTGPPGLKKAVDEARKGL